jgi:hypothetical protein
MQSQKDIVRYQIHHVAGFDWCRYSVFTSVDTWWRTSNLQIQIPFL